MYTRRLKTWSNKNLNSVWDFFFFPSLAQNICFYFHSFCQQRKYIGITRRQSKAKRTRLKVFFSFLPFNSLCFAVLYDSQKRNLFNMLSAFYLMLVSANFTLCITQFVSRFFMVIFKGWWLSDWALVVELDILEKSKYIKGKFCSHWCEREELRESVIFRKVSIFHLHLNTNLSTLEKHNACKCSLGKFKLEYKM